MTTSHHSIPVQQILNQEERATLDEDAVLLLDNDSLRALFLEARHSLPANALEVVNHQGTR